jgi:cobalt-zinc-cadmium efflux system protein
VELVGGFLTNSLALLSDAAHVFADASALALSWAALVLACLPPTDRRTFGYHRAEIFAALINALSLLFVAGIILYEAVGRLLHPEGVRSLEMLVVAAVGFVANVVVVMLLRQEDRSNLNVSSAWLHVLGDAAASAAVMAGGAVMLVTGWFVVDPLLSMGIAGLLLVGGWRVAEQSAHILLEGTPRDLSLSQIQEAIEAIPGVSGSHDLHVWSLCSDYRAMSVHVVVEPQATDDTGTLLRQIETVLRDRFNIVHTTLQVESIECHPQEHNHVVSARFHGADNHRDRPSDQPGAH